MERPWNNRKHQGGYQRETSDPRYHTSRWTKLSRRLRGTAAFALCAECRKKGLLVPAEVVDHIKPAFLCNDQEFYDPANLQPLCQTCNHAKGQKDKKLK